MISIIISTYREDYFILLKKNIEETIGIEYEIIPLENSEGDKGLCQIYNLGVQKAKYPFLCFAHEDISIKTFNWGIKVVELFQTNAKLGLLGIAGSSYKPAVFSGWSFPWANKQTKRENLIQTDKVHKSSFTVYNNPNNELLSKVAAVDGLWFCTTKRIALEIPFDESLFEGFHCYDVDFSLSVIQKYDVAVTFEILIEHFSNGSFKREWIDETIKLHKKWEKELPINLEGLTKRQFNNEEEGAFCFFLSKLIDYGCLDISLFKYLWQKNIRSLFTIKTFFKLNYLVARSIVK